MNKRIHDFPLNLMRQTTDNIPLNEFVDDFNVKI